jgi:Endoribonuclease L-PSP
VRKKCIFFRHVSRGGKNVYITGTVGQSFLTGLIAPGGLEAQLNKSLDNIALQLSQAGCTFEDIFHVETLLRDLSLVPTVNKLYRNYFGDRRFALVSQNLFFQFFIQKMGCAREFFLSLLQGRFVDSQRLVAGMKHGAELQHIVDAKDCAFKPPQYSVTPT